MEPLHRHLCLFGPLLFLTALTSRASPTPPNSYMCLSATSYNLSDYCLGISPGLGDPVFDPNNIYYAQVKSETKTTYKATDYKKTRWDLNFTYHTLSLGNFPLCLARIPGAAPRQAALYPCSEVITHQFNITSQDLNGVWDLSPWLLSKGYDQAGKLELLGADGTQCLTVMKCEPSNNNFCNPGSIVAAVDTNGRPDDLQTGSYVRFMPCYDYGKNPKSYLKTVQVWRQRSDCAPGCPPWLQFNNECEEVCNIKACQYDGGNCNTKSPTPPTASPTKVLAPTVPGKTPEPTFPHTLSPTYACPSFALIDRCPQLSRKQCLSKHVTKNCIWCPTLNLCQARSSNPRVCVTANVYQYCQPPCPTAIAQHACPNATSVLSCHGGVHHPEPCTWCRNSNTCVPGKLAAACTISGFYDHCNPPTPSPPFCPSPAQLKACLVATTGGSCTSHSFCEWCVTDSQQKCRPMGAGVCRAASVNEFFQFCPGFGSTPTPTVVG